MAFHHRKLLPGKPDPVGDNSSAIPKPCPKICLPPCPDHCNAIPPTPPTPPTPKTVHNTSIILVIVLCFLGFAFLIVSYLSIIRYRSNVRNSRRRNLQAFNDSGEGVVHENHDQVLDHHVWYIRTVGLQQSVIDLIEVFKYKKGGGLVEGSDCSVCLSEFQEDENLKLLPKCSHAFHIHCIDTWLRSHKNCPVCRAPVVNEGNVGVGVVEELDSDSSGSEEGNRVENGSNLAEVGSDEEGGDGSGEMRMNCLEACSSLSIEDDDVDEISDKNLCFEPARGNKVRGKHDMDDDGVTLDVELESEKRSISIDCCSSSVVYLGEENNFQVKDEGSSSSKEDEGTSNCHSEGEMKQTSEIVPRSGNLTSSIYNLVKSSSLGRSLQNVPLSMKRSFTSGGKSSLPIHKEDSS